MHKHHTVLITFCIMSMHWLSSWRHLNLNLIQPTPRPRCCMRIIQPRLWRNATFTSALRMKHGPYCAAHLPGSSSPFFQVLQPCLALPCLRRPFSWVKVYSPAPALPLLPLPAPHRECPLTSVGALADLARHNTRSAGTSKVGGRVDVSKDINEIKFTASLTDASARDYEATPWIRDFIVSAEKKLNCATRSPTPQVMFKVDGCQKLPPKQSNLARPLR